MSEAFEVNPERRRIVRQRRVFDGVWFVAVGSCVAAVLAVLGCGILAFQLRVATAERDAAREGRPYLSGDQAATIASLEDTIRALQSRPVQVNAGDAGLVGSRLKALYALSCDFEVQVNHLKGNPYGTGCSLSRSLAER